MHQRVQPFSGTGLGLSLCREIIEAHGGRVSVSNREGGGVEVSFWLPREPSRRTLPE